MEGKEEPIFVDESSDNEELMQQDDPIPIGDSLSDDDWSKDGRDHFDDDSDDETNEQCTFEEEALNKTLYEKTINAKGSARFDPLVFLKEKENTVKRTLQKQMKKKGAIKYYISIMVQFKKVKNGETELAWPHFRGNCYTALKTTDLEQAWQETVKKMYESFMEYSREGSSWVLDFIVHLRIHSVKWKPIHGSSFITTPVKLQNTKAIINVQNKDNRCFLWAVLSALYPQKSHAERVKKYVPFESTVNMNGIEYPVKLKNIHKFESNNPDISVNVFGYDDSDGIHPLHVTRKRVKSHIDLLLLSNDKKNHFCWIKNLNRLLCHTIPGSGNTRKFCPYCLHGYTKQSLLEDHITRCQNNGPQKIQMPTEDNKWLYFKDINKQLKAPWIIYCDSESYCEKIHTCQPNPKSSFTQKLTKHIPSGFCYKVVGPTDDHTRPAVVISGEDVTDRFMEDLFEIEEEVDEWYQNERKPLVMKDGDAEKFKSATHCHICDKFLGEDRVKDHDHVTGNYRGAAHNNCNINFKFRGRIPVVFHNLKNYDAHHIMQSIGKFGERLDVIPTNFEKYVSFRTGKFDFIDSLQFMNASLGSLVDNLAIEGHDKFKHMKSEFEDDDVTLNLLLRKGVFCYSHFDSLDKFNEEQLPPIEAFHNDLTDEDLNKDDYDHAWKVWKHFEMETFEEYHDLYLKTDVLLLADVFENFRNISMNIYSLDPAHFLTAPGLAWAAALKYTDVRLELLTDYDMHLFIETAIRGGISMISKRHARANNPLISDYDPEKTTSYISYLDCNNLYGCSMSKPLPTHGFRWLSTDEIEKLGIKSIHEDAEDGYILEVDLEYPSSLHDLHSDYPLAPETKEIKPEELSPYSKMVMDAFEMNTSGIVRKLVPNLHDKKHYTLHYRNLQQYIDLGMVLKKIHRVLTFKQSRWLKPYIDLNTNMRRMAKNTFEKNFFKLMNNSAFGKTMENLKLRRAIQLINEEARLLKLSCKPTFQAFKIFNEDLAAVELKKVSILLNKPIYCGFTILDVSKTIMYDFHYKHMLPKYGSRASLCFTDTDSLCYHIETDDVYMDMLEDKDIFDTSDYPLNHFLHSDVNKKVLGKFKDETSGSPPSSFVGLRPKMYSLLVNNEAKKTAKGVTKCVVKNEISHDDYLEAVLKQKMFKHTMKQIRSVDHNIFTLKLNKITLNPFDDKRYILDDGIRTLAHGHYRIQNMR